MSFSLPFSLAFSQVGKTKRQAKGTKTTMSVLKLKNEFGMYVAFGMLNGREVHGYGFSHLSAINSFLKNIWTM